MAHYALLLLSSLLTAYGGEVEVALANEDICAAGEDCSLEFHQLRASKLDLSEAYDMHEGLASSELEDDDDDLAEKTELGEPRGSCRNPTDMAVWKGGGKRTFSAAINHCARSCHYIGPWYSGPNCIKDCMQKRNYSVGCTVCMADLVGCKMKHCRNSCFSSDDDPKCVDCMKYYCRHGMRLCSGLTAPMR